MGGDSSKESEVELRMSHPKFQQAKLITLGDERVLRATVGADSKTYNDWVEWQELKPYPQFLLVPLRYSFSTKALCGNTGAATVA